MDFNNISTTDQAGNIILYQAPRYFSQLIKNRFYEFQEYDDWKVVIKDDILYPFDREGCLIREAGRPVKDIVQLANTIQSLLWGYAHLRNHKINWDYIIYQAENRLRELKTNEAIEVGNNSFYGVTFDTPVQPEKDLHIIKSPSEIPVSSLPQPSKNLWMNIWKERELCCLFADSNLGKSALAVQIGVEIAKSQKVLFCDYEMSDDIFFTRYRDPGGNYFRFPANFFRSKPIPEVFLSAHPETILLKDLEKMIKDRDFKVIIIDNISFLGRDCYRPRNLSALIYRLKILQQKYDLSILILAHTGKRKENTPISQNDLQGSKRLFNFIDSCFAIGKATNPNGCQYIKQLKSRSGHIEFGENNVILAERVFSNGWLHFDFKGNESEQTCLNIIPSKTDIDIPEEINRLTAEGMTQRQIASRLEISLSKVNRILNKIKSEN